MRSAIVGVILVAVLAAVAPRGAEAQERLPQFALVGRDGRAVVSAALVRPGKWLIVYVPSECGGCAALLRLVVKSEHPAVPSRIVIVVGAAPADTVRAAAAQFPDLDEAGWYADPTGAAATPLRVGSAPAIYGMNGDTIDWTLSGVLAASPDVKSVLERWIEK